MKKMAITTILFAIYLQAFAPAMPVLYVSAPEKIQVFDPMLYAFKKVESNFNSTVVNSLGYGGDLQIGQEMIDEVNRICTLHDNPMRFVLHDRFDPTKSTQIWYIVQNYRNPNYSMRKACRIWNPLASVNYYNKIKKVYEQVKLTD